VTSATAEAAPTARAPSATRAARRRRPRPSRIALHLFLIVTAALWLAPVAWAVYTSLRPYSDTAERGYVSLPGSFSFENYTNVWTQADLPHFFGNSMMITIPAIVLTLLFASAVAFVVSRLSFWFNVPMLIFFMAANLLPPQVVLTPLYRMYLEMPLPMWLSDSGLFYDSYVGLIAINVAFQTGFCTFVLSNYMKTIPSSLTEAARVDGAGVVRQFFGIILPLCKPALAALATLEFTWIYNDFLWAVVLMGSGDKRPITTAIQNLQGQYFIDNNLLAAASILVALPTLVVFAALQRQFISGLTLGAQKG
jgi:multiple sugar transport system permease protein